MTIFLQFVGLFVIFCLFLVLLWGTIEWYGVWTKEDRKLLMDHFEGKMWWGFTAILCIVGLGLFRCVTLILDLLIKNDE